jgi:alkylation response protein AidB-like acyl-CoA dehydrogenase
MQADPASRARRWVQDVVQPNIRTWERSTSYPRAAVVASGLTGMFSPAADGGLDLSPTDAIGVFEQLGRGDAALAFSISMHNAVAAAVTRAGSERVRDRWAGPLVSGEALGCLSLTEPQAGSDATAITTRATRDGAGDLWRVTGRKAWVSLGGEADVYALVAKTSDQPGHSDIAMFVVDGLDPGIRHSAPYDKAVSSFLPITDMELADVSAQLLVPPGEGMRAALGAIDVARFDIAAIANGLHAEALDVATAYALERTAFGKPLLEHQGLAFALADVATELEAARGLTHRAAKLLGTADGRVAVAHAKRFGPDVAVRAAIACSEVLGANGWLNDHPLARFISLAKMLQVVDGTAEIQRIVIARDLANSVAGCTRSVKRQASSK